MRKNSEPPVAWACVPISKNAELVSSRTAWLCDRLRGLGINDRLFDLPDDDWQAQIEHIRLGKLSPFLDQYQSDYSVDSIEGDGDTLKCLDVVCIASRGSLTATLRVLWSAPRADRSFLARLLEATKSHILEPLAIASKVVPSDSKHRQSIQEKASLISALDAGEIISEGLASVFLDERSAIH